MRVLLTGAAGFIGSHVVDLLVSKGHDVMGIDNLSVGNMNNLKQNMNKKNFTFKKMDVLAKKEFEEMNEDFDMIVHEAAYKIPKLGNTKKTMEINTLGTHNMLELARKKDAMIAFASTSDVYGKSKEPLFSEEGDLVLGSPSIKRWAYAVSKIFDEHLVRAYHEEYGLKFIIFRYFNSYGIRNSLSWLGGPVPVFMANILQNKPLEVHGDGKQRRCYCYVSDIAEGTILGINNKNAWNDTYNIGNDKTDMSITELAELVKKVSGKTDIQINYVPHEKLFGKYDEIYKRVPDLKKAREKLNYEPKVGLEEGLRITYEWQSKL